MTYRSEALRNLILHPEEQSLAEKSDHSSMSGTVKTQALTPLETPDSNLTSRWIQAFILNLMVLQRTLNPRNEAMKGAWYPGHIPNSIPDAESLRAELRCILGPL
ncbi:hypothetical protein Y1Q_0018983 [Alligator mississippiensis]|uniref:Uncharacterized protein n=1 Tax=Alligator mississippiensis TaxID=8496 RepID=A0A151M3D4_ALLMI|nr:hypothetical protein Y1Q_0018983 [Alligator mississippiensis]